MRKALNARWRGVKSTAMVMNSFILIFLRFQWSLRRGLIDLLSPKWKGNAIRTMRTVWLEKGAFFQEERKTEKTRQEKSSSRSVPTWHYCHVAVALVAGKTLYKTKNCVVFTWTGVLHSGADMHTTDVTSWFPNPLHKLVDMRCALCTKHMSDISRPSSIFEPFRNS